MSELAPSRLHLEKIKVDYGYGWEEETTLPFELIRQILDLAECQLATVEHLESLKRPPVGQLKRHREIERKFFGVLRDFGLLDVLEKSKDTIGARMHCPRVIKRLNEHPLYQLARQAD